VGQGGVRFGMGFMVRSGSVRCVRAGSGKLGSGAVWISGYGLGG
jgi:hypothetical protein